MSCEAIGGLEVNMMSIVKALPQVSDEFSNYAKISFHLLGESQAICFTLQNQLTTQNCLAANLPSSGFQFAIERLRMNTCILWYLYIYRIYSIPYLVMKYL